MSGSIGADRIQRSAVQSTVDFFEKKVLSKFPGYKSSKITGSYNTGVKKDHGDVDLAVFVEGEEAKKVRKELKAFFESQPDDLTVPFRTGTNKGKKAQMYGNIVTCQVPIQGFEGMTVQVDCVVVLSEKEQQYQKSFLDLPASKQVLLTGIVRVILQEENPEKVFARMGIKKLPELDKNQEFEFVLSSAGLSLRKITYGDDYKEVKREEVWRSHDWDDVQKLLQDYDLEQDYDALLHDVSQKLQDPRSKRRVLGIMKSMVNIGPGEKGTPKGDEKERSIQVAQNKLGALEEISEETSKGVIALYGGGFKPPHKAHFANAQKLASKADKLIIFIGPKVREGVPITADQSKEIWDIYRNYINIPVEVQISAKAPITDIYGLIGNEELRDTKFIIGKSEGVDEDKKWAYFNKNKDKYPNVTLKTLPTIADKEDKKFSASTLRKSIEIIKKGTWMPGCLDRDDFRKVLEILIEPLEQKAIEEEMKAGIGNIIDSAVRGVVGDKQVVKEHIAPAATVSAEGRDKLVKLYQQLEATVPSDLFSVEFKQNGIIIRLSDQAPGNTADFTSKERQYSLLEGEGQSFDYVPYMVSFLKFLQDQGYKIQPLPEIVLSKEKQEGGILQAKTGHYDPGKGILTVYGAGRDPKDVLRSFAHETYHHIQCLEGRIGAVQTESISDSKELEELESEAYQKGNILFRKWTEQENKKGYGRKSTQERV